MNVLGVDPFWLGIIAKVAGALTSLAAINKFLVKPIRKNVVAKAKTFYEKVNTIEAEMRPNGGGSLRDAIDRIHQVSLRLDQRQRSFFQFDPNGIFEMNEIGELVWMNRSYMDLCRRHAEEVLGFGWRSCIADRDRSRVINEFEYAVRDRRDCVVRYAIADIEGREIPVEIRALRMIDEKNKLIGYLGFMARTDIPVANCRWCRNFELSPLPRLDERHHKGLGNPKKAG